MSAGWPDERWLARGMNPLRWVEYAFSSTVMIVAIAYLSFINDGPALIGIAAANVAMILFGWSMEAANEGRASVDWKHYIFGCNGPMRRYWRTIVTAKMLKATNRLAMITHRADGDPRGDPDDRDEDAARLAGLVGHAETRLIAADAAGV